MLFVLMVSSMNDVSNQSAGGVLFDRPLGLYSTSVEHIIIDCIIKLFLSFFVTGE